MLGVAFFLWKSSLTWVENWSRRSSMVGGISASGGVQEDLT